MNHRETARILRESLGLRWEPVAIRLLKPGESKPPSAIEPAAPLRHCQSVIAARRGNCLYMPPRAHACPDGAGIIGLVEMAPKLRSGELYLLFKKLPDIETARQMIASRPEFPPGSYGATLLAPLASAPFAPDAVIFTLWPEQAMWLCCAQTYATGERQDFKTSGFNSACSDLVVQPLLSGEMNISFGCYGSRAASEIDDFELYLSVPADLLEKIVPALQKLSRKSIPESRRKIYLPPVLDNVGARRSETGGARLVIDTEQCVGDGVCVDFCPTAVLEMDVQGDRLVARAVYPEKCSRCYTCVGQCPTRAIQILNTDGL
jgi:uncharacterized protein (DUF169 family)/NAD-dependent dihydropyrimidine dehydrogenase PreA subunit